MVVLVDLWRNGHALDYFASRLVAMAEAVDAAITTSR
jgi:hypothetical protein